MNELELYKTQTRYISHEIRNHLSICELYSEIIKKRMEKEGIKNDSIEGAIHCIQKSLKIIGYSLIDLKSLNNFSPQKTDLKTTLETAIKMGEAYINEKNIEICKELENNITVELDENKFLACIVNIIKNAIEAIEITGKISVRSSIDDNGKAQVIISNTGKPISIDKQKEIFEEGFTTKTTGSGLGLHICKTNLALQNAKLQLDKSDEYSTEFKISIPICN